MTKNQGFRELIYQVSKKIFGDKVPPQIEIEIDSSALWEVSDPLQLENITAHISVHQTLDKFSVEQNESPEEICIWMSDLVSHLSQASYATLLDKYHIVPNQNGRFCPPSELFYESELIDELLKDIAAELRRDFRDELIDQRFSLNIPKSRSIDAKKIAQEISEAVYPRLSENPRAEATQRIFNKIILWMDENPELAIEIFPGLAENRHKLYDDREIAANLRKVSALESEVKQLSEENLSLKTENQTLEAKVKELEEQLRVSGQTVSIDKETPVTQEVNEDFLITYGITTQDQLDRLLQDSEFSGRYFVRSREYLISKFQYVQEIIQRAKKNIRQYLTEHKDYDCSEWQELSETVIGGVLKRGHKIRLVVRPSDNRKVVFYYSEDKDILELSDSELWVENGKSQPHRVTLGMVLKLKSIDILEL